MCDSEGVERVNGSEIYRGVEFESVGEVVKFNLFYKC